MVPLPRSSMAGSTASVAATGAKKVHVEGVTEVPLGDVDDEDPRDPAPRC